MEKLFFELIRVSTGQLDCLSRGPEPEEWHELYEMARHQRLLGVCYRGAQHLFEFGLRVPQDLIIDWMAEAEAIEQQNAIVDKRCAKVQQRLTERGMRASVLGGQGAAHDYVETLQSLRQPDGIDIYTDSKLEKVRKFVELTGQEHVRHDHRQVYLEAWDDTAVRLHYQLYFGKNPLKSKKQRQWFKKNQRSMFMKDGEMTRPSASVNVIYILVHLYWQFLYEGITLRDLMDCSCALKRAAAVEQQQVMDYGKVLKELGIYRFSQGVMYVMEEVFGLEKEAMVVEPLEDKGDFILDEVMAGKHHFFHLFLKYPVEMLYSLL